MGELEQGTKWWVRYAVVPLLGGGIAAALIAAFNTRRNAEPMVPQAPPVAVAVAMAPTSTAPPPAPSATQAPAHAARTELVPAPIDTVSEPSTLELSFSWKSAETGSETFVELRDARTGLLETASLGRSYGQCTPLDRNWAMLVLQCWENSGPADYFSASVKNGVLVVEKSSAEWQGERTAGPTVYQRPMSARERIHVVSLADARSESEVHQGLSLVGDRVKSCAPLCTSIEGVGSLTHVTAEVRVSSDGDVVEQGLIAAQSVGPRQLPRKQGASPLRPCYQCIENAIRTARFPKSKGPTVTVKHEFTVRAD